MLWDQKNVELSSCRADVRMFAKKSPFLPPPAVITGGYYIGHLQREHVFNFWAREILRWRYRCPLDGAHNSRDDNGSKNTCLDRRPTCFHITYNYSRGYDYKATCNMPQHNRRSAFSVAGGGCSCSNNKRSAWIIYFGRQTTQQECARPDTYAREASRWRRPPGLMQLEPCQRDVWS